MVPLVVYQEYGRVSVIVSINEQIRQKKGLEDMRGCGHCIIALRTYGCFGHEQNLDALTPKHQMPRRWTIVMPCNQIKQGGAGGIGCWVRA